MTIKNRKQVVEQLADLLIGFEEQRNEYQTDVYAYYDDQSGDVRLELFKNPSGTEFRDDDHVIIYRDFERSGDILDSCFSFEQLVDALEIEKNELKSRAAEFFEIDPDDVLFWHVSDYIRSECGLLEKVNDAWRKHLLEIRFKFINTAEEFVAQYEGFLGG